MKHEVLVADTATPVEHPSQTIVCNFADASPGPIALGFTLLADRMIDELILRPALANWVIRLRLHAEPRALMLRRYADRRLEISIGDARSASFRSSS